MKIAQAKLEYRTPAVLGEGALWDDVGSRLLWVDILGQQVSSYDPVRRINTTRAVGKDVGTVVLTTSGKYLVATSHGFRVINPENGEETFLCDPEEDISSNRFNDGKCDAQGRFWAGTMGYTNEPGAGSLYRLDANGQSQKVLGDVSISNGLAWSADETSFFYIDTPTQELRRYAYDKEAGTISQPEVICRFPSELGSPDGMTLDAQGFFYVAMWGGSCVLRVSPAGELVEKLELPTAHVTSCALGGPELKTLFITTATVGLSEQQRDEQALAGSLFSYSVDSPGVRSNRYAAL